MSRKRREPRGISPGFRNGPHAKIDGTHAAHVAMAACYCLRYDKRTALERARDRTRNHNTSIGTENTEDAGYHETLTEENES